jgi:hypothetical protein
MIMKPQSSEDGQSISNISKTGWQIIGELELPFGVDAHSTINIWLSEVLAPLHLHVGFLSKVLKWRNQLKVTRIPAITRLSSIYILRDSRALTGQILHQ